MNKHLTQEQFVGYINQTLTDIQREAINQHLVECPRCRAGLSEHEALERRIHHSLLADMRSVQPSPAMTFAAIAPRLKRGFTMSRTRSRQLRFGIAIVAMLAIALTALFMNSNRPTGSVPITRYISLAPRIAYAQDARPTANIGSLQSPSGWFLTGDQAQNYAVGVDRAVTHGGAASAYIEATVAEAGGFGTLMQMFRADNYRGRRLRLSGYVRTENVREWAGLWMRVDGSANEVLSFDNMQDRPITGTTDWQRYEIVLDVPENSLAIAFGVLLVETGRVWIDDIQFDIVGEAAPTTDVAGVTEPPHNLGFEEGDDGWDNNRPMDYDVEVDRTLAHGGRASGHIEAKVLDPGDTAMLRQSGSASTYQGKRLRMSGYVRTEDVDGWAGLFLQASGSDGAKVSMCFDDMRDRPIGGTNDWREYQVVVDVPENGDRIVFGVSLVGGGQVWLDDMQFEVVGRDVPLTGWCETVRDTSNEPSGSMYPPQPGDTAWFLTGSHPQHYAIGITSAVFYSGGTSRYIRSREVVSRGFGTLMQMFRADDYRGKRLRLSGYVRAENVREWAGLWMRVDGNASAVFGFDNMQDRPITGTVDWQEYEVVLDVPEDSADIAFGILLAGEGQVWVDDFRFTVAGADVPVTGFTFSLQPQNLGFED